MGWRKTRAKCALWATQEWRWVAMLHAGARVMGFCCPKKACNTSKEQRGCRNRFFYYTLFWGELLSKVEEAQFLSWEKQANFDKGFYYTRIDIIEIVRTRSWSFVCAPLHWTDLRKRHESWVTVSIAATLLSCPYKATFNIHIGKAYKKVVLLIWRRFFRRYRRSSSSMHRSQAPKSRVIERPPNLTTRVLLWSSPLLQCYLFWLITPFMVLYNEKKWKNDRWIHSLCSISITRLFGWHLRWTRNMKEHWHYYTAFWASPFELCYYTLFWGDRAIERWYTLQLLSHENFFWSCILI